MNPTRIVSAFALGAALSGCAGNTGPVATSAISPPSAHQNSTVALALPERVETVPFSVSSPSIDSLPPTALPSQSYTESALPYVATAPIAVAPARLEAPRPSYVLQSPGYVAQAAPLSRGQMAPVRDDPIGGARVSPPTRATTYNVAALKAAYQPSEALSVSAPSPKVYNAHTPDFGDKLSRSALSRLNPNVAYVAAYKKIGYPWGDVPENTGVCTDVVIRSYRGLGIDLQSMVHEDMKQAFSAYPSRKIYGLKEADPNIDHRRVVNLEAFFERVGASIPLGSATMPGDIITWRLSGGEPHIGVVVDRRDPKTGNFLIVHNLGGGVQAEDLMDYAPPHGHYRFAPDQQSRLASIALRRG